MRKEMKIEMSIFFLLASMLGMLWYYMWVKPADEMRYEIMSCMSDIEDNSVEGYKQCKKSLEAARESR